MAAVVAHRARAIDGAVFSGALTGGLRRIHARAKQCRVAELVCRCRGEGATEDVPEGSSGHRRGGGALNPPKKGGGACGGTMGVAWGRPHMPQRG